tara:strand:+ start:1298 stop:1738 length:441 start_codon:yes stop_codon:yes gene_type:complete
MKSYFKKFKSIINEYLNTKQTSNNKSPPNSPYNRNDNISFDSVYSIKSSDSDHCLSSRLYLSSPKFMKKNDMSLISISSDGSISSMESQENLCCICLQDLKESKSMNMTQCHHSFHVKCVKQWLVEKSTCPLCNSNQDKLKERLNL